MNILITICARGGSKGVPGKNIKPINGIPLIGYSINIALNFCKKYRAHIALSTDSEEIKLTASSLGLKSSYTRPDSLSNDNAGKIDVINDILIFEEKKNKLKYDYILDLDVTSPLRNLNDLEHAFSMIKKDLNALNIFSVSPSHKNPYFNMIEKEDSGYVRLSKQRGVYQTRQSLPEVFDMNASFYFFTRKFFELGYRTSITDKSLAYIVPHICFDIDRPIDFIIMEHLISQNKLDFRL